MEKVYISDEEKREIMDELARGNPDMISQEPNHPISQDQQNIDDKNYQNFDDFAQRKSPNELQNLSSPPLPSEPSELGRHNSIKEEITTNLNQAKEAGQLRAGRIREIVATAVFQLNSELKEGTKDIRSVVKDAVSATIEALKGKGGEIKEEITASIEGAVEGISTRRRQSIAKTQAEVKQLQSKLETEEDELQQEVNRLLAEVEEAGKDTQPSIKTSIDSAIHSIRNSDEVALLQKRYAQLQAQAAIIKANLAARYAGRNEEVKEHLNEAKTWYDRTRNQAEPVVDQFEQKRAQIEEQLSTSGTTLAKRERQIRQLLSELLQLASNRLREKEPPAK